MQNNFENEEFLKIYYNYYDTEEEIFNNILDYYQYNLKYLINEVDWVLILNKKIKRYTKKKRNTKKYLKLFKNKLFKFPIYQDNMVYNNYKFNPNNIKLYRDDDILTSVQDMSKAINRCYYLLILGYKNYLANREIKNENIFIKSLSELSCKEDSELEDYFTLN